MLEGRAHAREQPDQLQDPGALEYDVLVVLADEIANGHRFSPRFRPLWCANFERGRREMIDQHVNQREGGFDHQRTDRR